MALRKPSEYFNSPEKEKVSVSNNIEKLVSRPELSTFSDTFEHFKSNLTKIEALSDFSEALDNYSVNVDRINYLSTSIEDIKEEIKSLLKKEDLDRAIMAQLLIVEQSIQEVQNKVKEINKNDLSEIKSEVFGLTEIVNNFIEDEVPNYKKLIVDSELRVDHRFSNFQENVNSTIQTIGEFVNLKYQELTESLEGINQEKLDEIVTDFQVLDDGFQKIVSEEIPNYKKLIVDSEVRTDRRFSEFQENINSTLQTIGEVVDSKCEELTESLEGINQEKLDEIVLDFKNLEIKFQKILLEEIPKYKKFIVESELKSENKINEFDEKLQSSLNSFDSTVSDIIEKINLVETDKNELILEVTSQINKVKQLSENVSKELENNQLYKEDLKESFASLQVDVIRNEKHLREYNKNILEIQQEFQEKVSDFQASLNLNEDTIRSYNKNILELQKEFEKKALDLEIVINLNEKHIQLYNKNLLDIEDTVKETLSKINFEEIEKQNYELGKKVKYLQEVFEKFSEKEILTENVITEPPTTKNSDPLTPLDKNFVTLEQLQQHYRLFINRIQQQLSTLGGGGETKLKYLDDIVGIATNPSAYDGKYLKYNDSIKKFEFESVSSGGGSGESYWAETNTGIHTLSNVGIGTTNPISKLQVEGDVLISGIVTALSFDGNSTSSTYSQTSGISTYASIAGIATYATTSGIATYASSSGIATYATTSGIATYASSSGIATYATFSGIATYASIAGIATYAEVSGTSNYAIISGISTVSQGLTGNPNITITDLQVNGNANINGNLSIGGTTVVISATTLTIADKDIVLGISTSPTDITANHGGISIASTEGNPLIPLHAIGINTLPDTYKQLMWIKSGTFAGLNTDTWISNYPISIGTTSAQLGSRFTVGTGFTVFDTYLDATDIKVKNINATGIITSTVGFFGDLIGNATTSGISTYASSSGIATYASIAGIATYATSSGIATYASIAGIATYATSSGIATYATSSGIATYASIAGIATYASSSGIATYASIAGISTYASIAGIATYATSSGIATYASIAGIATYATSSGIATYATSSGIATYASIAGIATYASSSGIATYASIAGISTYASIAGIATYASIAGIATYASSSGIATVAQGLTGTPNIVVGVVTASSFIGDGTQLTGIVTSISAGSGITINQSTGNVTITATSSSSTNLGLVVAATYNMLMP